MKKNHEIRFRVTKNELDSYKKKAKDAGLTLTSLCKILLQNSTVKVVIAE